MRPVVALALGAAALALTACVPYVVPSDGPFAFQPPANSAMDALLMGTLHIDDGCAWVETEGEDYIPVFPMNAAREEAGELIYGGRHGDGDRIMVGGGETDEPRADWYIPSGCPDLKLWDASEPPQG